MLTSISLNLSKKIMQDIYDYLEPISLAEISEDEGYVEGQFGKIVATNQEEEFNINAVDIIIVGVKETRGNSNGVKENDAAKIIRKNLYRLHYWHTDIKIADIGNIKTGATLKDSYAAIKTVLEELYNTGKTILILGGSHDITLSQYHAFKKNDTIIEATCIDAFINLNGETSAAADNFLMEMFTEEPNILKHYNHIAFQSYFVHPKMLQTIDKLRFDCFRLGHVVEDIVEMEPALRNSHMLSFDISALKHSDAPTNKLCPNGLTGVEACILTQYAGMSSNLKSFGIYGYNPADDANELTAVQIAQMLWYFVDGIHRKNMESPLTDLNSFNEYNIVFGEIETVFLQNKRTKRWWMQMPDKKYVACSHKDYLTAIQNEIPERWFRIQERI
jgi:formiminoglutamase